MKRIILPIICLLMFCACTDIKTSTKKGSSGKTLEVLFVADGKIYNANTSTKRIVDSLFKAPQKGLPQPEPKFDVVNIPVSSFSNTQMFQMCRNIIVCDIKADNPNKIYLNTDKWAQPQVVYELAAKDQKSLDSLLIKYYPSIEKELYRNEHKRIINAFMGIKSPTLIDQIQEMLGFRLAISDEFELCKMRNPQPDMAWIRKEAKDFGIGVLMKVTPYTDKDQLKETKILATIDSVMSHVEGPADTSYMAIERRAAVLTEVSDFSQSPYAMETRGCWRLFGDFMGGPFVAYTLLTPDNKQVITLIGYAYCPRFGKRDYLMQVEGICHSIKF